MYQVTFETAGLAAAVGKAARVAPSKGMAFDKAAGIMIEGDPTEDDHKAITIRATNLEVDYLEWVRPLEIKADEPFSWRLPSLLFSGFVGGLPIGSGKTVTIKQDEPRGRITLKSGKTTARIAPILGDGFKSWEPFDGTDLAEVTGFASRVNQAAWATDPENVPFSGIHIDGENIYATDRYRMVRVPCKVPLEKPVTVPLDVLAPILKSVEDVRLGVTEGHLLLMPDEYTQMQAVIFSAEYPDIERAMKTDFNVDLILPRIAFRDAVARMLSLVGRGERYPRIRLGVHKTGTVDLSMEVEGVGRMDDEVDVEIEFTVDDPDDDVPSYTELFFSPNYITDALDQTKKGTVRFSYRHDRTFGVARITDDEGYDVWLMPRKLTDPAPVKKDEE